MNGFIYKEVLNRDIIELCFNFEGQTSHRKSTLYNCANLTQVLTRYLG